MKKTILISLSLFLLLASAVLVSAEEPTRTESCYTYSNQWTVCTERQTIENDFVKNDQAHYNYKSLVKKFLYNPEQELVDKIVYMVQSNYLATDPCEDGIGWNLHTWISKTTSAKPTTEGFIATTTTEKYKDGELQFIKIKE